MKTVLFWLFVLVVCTYCHVQFKSIGRHAWRCKEKLNNRESVNERNEQPTLIDRSSVQETHNTNEAVLRNQDDDLSVELDGLISDDTPGLKPGVKLPKNECEWREANLYFRAELPICDVNEKSINECAIKMSNLVYDYFAENFGTVNKKNALDEEFDKKYANYTKQELKRELKALKHQSITDVNNIRYVSKLLRN
ncbi:Hypothetical predicted protein [Paramuricea clavata]|uniref:Uncharacterized protein n=1 Tax=Paramuricea clavata TaxID=317549 RepID=A0A6S7JV76_PARCT|nr:Hypothetical predicted protein [Paramuricea clavata]